MTISRRVKINRRKVREAIKGSSGICQNVADRCNIAYSCLYRFLQKPENRDLHALMLEEREKIIDVAENKLYKKVQEEDWNAIKFTLQTLGAKRGFTEKAQIDHNIHKIEVQELPPITDVNTIVIEKEDDDEFEDRD